jgi:hypothetical protein
MIFQPLFRVGDIHVFTGLFEKRRRHHAESILIVPSGKIFLAAGTLAFSLMATVRVRGAVKKRTRAF